MRQDQQLPQSLSLLQEPTLVSLKSQQAKLLCLVEFRAPITPSKLQLSIMKVRESRKERALLPIVKSRTAAGPKFQDRRVAKAP